MFQPLGLVPPSWPTLPVSTVRKNSARATAQPPRLPALMFAEAVWKQIEKKKLPAERSVDVAQVRALGRQLDESMLGRMLFELAAAAREKGLDPEGALRLHATKIMRDLEAKAAGTTDDTDSKSAAGFRADTRN